MISSPLKRFDPFAETMFLDLFNPDQSKFIKYQARDWVPGQCAVSLKDDKLELAFSVQGHDPDDVEIKCTQDKISVKTNGPPEKDKDDIVSQFLSIINETIELMPEFNGTKAEAEIKYGILKITIPKKESAKPIVLKPKF